MSVTPLNQRRFITVSAIFERLSGTKKGAWTFTAYALGAPHVPLSVLPDGYVMGDSLGYEMRVVFYPSAEHLRPAAFRADTPLHNSSAFKSIVTELQKNLLTPFHIKQAVNLNWMFTTPIGQFFLTEGRLLRFDEWEGVGLMPPDLSEQAA